MKLTGEFILREVGGDILAIPVGKTALNFNGMIFINEVGAEIFKALQCEKTKDEILEIILEKFEVSHEEATVDLDDFLHNLREKNLLED